MCYHNHISIATLPPVALSILLTCLIKIYVRNGKRERENYVKHLYTIDPTRAISIFKHEHPDDKETRSTGVTSSVVIVHCNNTISRASQSNRMHSGVLNICIFFPTYMKINLGSLTRG